MMLQVNLVFVLAAFTFVDCQRTNEAIDSAFLESVLNAEECDRQISVIRNNVLLGLQFADAGIRIPKGVLIGGTVDLGNYHQCLGIKHSTDGMDIEGKYCAIEVPVDQTIEFPNFENPADRWTFNPNLSYLDKTSWSKLAGVDLVRAEIRALNGETDALEEYYARTIPGNPLSGSTFTFGVCVPKPCTTQQAIASLIYNVTNLGFEYTESFCRLPGDKPWSDADIAAVVIFSAIGLITLLSTSYDLYHRFVKKSDAKAIRPIYQSFSVYTNSQRLTTFNPVAGNLQCIDGIRTLAMIWVIIGHSFSAETFFANPIDAFTWMFSAEGLWITTGTMTVDTFFALGGLLLVYTTAGKMSSRTLLKHLHWFYVARLVRIMPLLAMTVLLQASFFNHMTDGPFWQTVAFQTNMCREYWWYTLMNIQNLFARGKMCTGHAWYVAIDVQLYIVSPIVLYWVLTDKKRNAWIALIGGLIIALTASTTYNFIMNFQGAVLAAGPRPSQDYMTKYYIHTITRAPPFIVGLISGYVLHLYRGKPVQMSWILAIFLWLFSFGIMGSIFYFKYRTMQFDWDNQFVDNFMNSFMRPAWACVIGWIIFACTHGYGGPINWFLSLDVWRLPARLTYGMYLLHYPFLFAINGTMLTPIYFSVGGFTFKFLAFLVLSVVASYIATVMVDSPVSALYKQLTIKVQPKKQAKQEINPDKMENSKTGDFDESKTIDVNDELRQRNVLVVAIK